MGILSWILLGLIAGWLAQFVTRQSPGPGGCAGIIVTIIVGIVGAFVGGLIGSALGWGTVNEFDIRSLLLAFVGAVIVLLIYGAIAGRKR